MIPKMCAITSFTFYLLYGFMMAWKNNHIPTEEPARVLVFLLISKLRSDVRVEKVEHCVVFY